VRVVAADERVATLKASGNFVELRSSYSTNSQGGFSVLHITPWERSALELLASGTTTRDMAGHLGVPEPEIQLRLTTLFARMGASTPADAIAAAFRRGLLAVNH
jgi:DNA-binding NarL/FixJ family response regulator